MVIRVMFAPLNTSALMSVHQSLSNKNTALETVSELTDYMYYQNQYNLPSISSHHPFGT